MWHYTDRRGFEGIVSSNSLWATSTDSLNDVGEVEFGLRDLRGYWASVRPQLKSAAPVAEMEDWLDSATARLHALDTFVVCGCHSVDSLVHWRSYIGDDPSQGFALGFRAEAEFRALQPPNGEALFQPDFVPVMFWTDVTYGARSDWQFTHNYWDPYKRLIEDGLDILDAIRTGRVTDVQGQLDVLDRSFIVGVLTSKHEAYSSEGESRLVAVGGPGYPWERQGRYGRQRIVTLAAADETDELERYSTPSASPLPLVAAMTGPWNDASDIAWATDLLASRGYDVPVSRSAVPIR
ncbi:MAG: hypothetical protein K0R60_136 [Microbacterium sp.]|nr:hypothetical protein [Microbacterium sp.]